MPNLMRSFRGARWWPDADSVNAPDGALLNADNMVPDPEGMLALRKGSSRVYSGLGGRVFSQYACLLDDEIVTFQNVEDKIFHDGVDFGETFDGEGDMAIGDDAYQVFFARGTTKKKFDGTHFYSWPIKAPEFPATLAAVAAITSTVATFNSGESPGFTVNEGTGAFVAGYDGTSNGALKLTPAASGRATASKIFASDQDFLNILGSEGSDTDLFDIYVWIEEVLKADKITIMFGLGTGSDAYRDDYYYFDFSIRDPSTVDIKDSGSTTASAYATIANQVQSVLTPDEITNVKTPEQVASILKRLGRYAGPRARERKDTQEASPAWTHLSVTRGQFNRVGGTAGRDWQTVRAFKVIYTSQEGATNVIQFDNAVWTGGGDRSLTGKYRLGYRFVRNFGPYFELSPISPITDPIVLTQQSLQVTLPAAALSGKDPQVNEIWVYLIGGFLDTYYRFAIVPAVINQGMTIDEVTNPAGSDFQTAGERTRLTAWGFTRISGDTTSSDLVFTLRKSELDALIENEKLEPGSVSAPDDIIAIAGPFNSRMFVLTREGRLYPSSQDNPSSFSLYHLIDLRRYGDPLWMKLTSGGIYVGMSKDILKIVGTGDESEDRVSVDLSAEPLHTGNPPFDESVICDGNSIAYRSIDGAMLVASNSITPLPSAGTSLLWRGQDRHGIEALNTTYGRFRFAIDNHILYMIAPEGAKYTPPIGAETIGWETLTGVQYVNDVLTKTAASGFNTSAVAATKFLESGDGFVRLKVTDTTTDKYIALCENVESNGDITKTKFAIMLTSSGQLNIYENGLQTSFSSAYAVGDRYRIEIRDGIVLYQKNASTVLYTSTLTPPYPLFLDVGFNQLGSSFSNPRIQGNWRLKLNSSNVVWQFDLVKQQWSRTVYPVNFMSFVRSPTGALLAGTDDGEVWELNSGSQDDVTSIDVNIFRPIDDGGDPLSRKDPLDLQVHCDTGGQDGTLSLYLDGSAAAAQVYTFSSQNPGVFRINSLDLGVFLKLQMRFEGAFSKFVLHSVNLQYRNRVQEVMVLDTGTISPNGPYRIVWLAEAEIDCISPVDLLCYTYLDDVQHGDPQTITVLPGQRSAYRFQLPRGTKARCPRLVFVTTNANGSSDPGFEPYRVRVKDRGTGTASENEFRPIWPVGQAP